MLKWLGVFIVFYWGYAVFCQTNPSEFYDDSDIVPQRITETDLETFKTNEDFNYEEVKEAPNIIDKLINWLQDILRQFWEAIFGVGTAQGFLYFIFRILPYILLGVLLFLLLRFFLKVNSNAITTTSHQKGQVSLSEEEQIIKHEDISALIKKAIAQGNFRLAIRYYYLQALKQLTDAKSIDWQPQKTNEDYINEISQSILKENFKSITKIYSYVWYGEFKVDAVSFNQLKQPFETLNKSIT